jgi:hypothetical protein
MRLRQVALVARDLDPVVAALCDVLGIEVAFRDPGVGVFGLHNAVLPLGDTFLEVVSPLAPDAPAQRYLERRGGDAGYMVMLETRELEAARKRAAELGVREAWGIELPDIRAVHLHPRDLGATLLSLDQPSPPGAWRWAGPDWRSHVRTERALGLRAAEIACREPRAVGERWSRLLGRPLEATEPDGLAIALEAGSALRFLPVRDAQGEGVCGVDVASPRPEAVLDAARNRGLPVRGDALVVGGTRLRPVPA